MTGTAVQTRRPNRAFFRHHGGKFRLADTIVSHFPEHDTYVEPFAGSASILLRKDRARAEVINDIDSQINNLFRVARDHEAYLTRALLLTPYSREEHALSFEPSDDPLEQARRTLVRCAQSIGSNAMNVRSGFRYDSTRNAARDWQMYPQALALILERLRGVIIERKDAFALIPDHDSPQTLFYIDPPYLMGVRADQRRDYRHELDETDHMRLAELLRSVRGAVVVSGYRSDLYDRLYEGWQRVDIPTSSGGRSPRVECLWLSRPARPNLFA